MWMSLSAHQGGVVRAAGVGYSRRCSDRTVAPGAVLSGHVYFTDGELTVGVLAPEGSAGTHAVTALPSPTPVVIKNQLWSWLRPLLGDGRAASAPGERR